MHYIEVVFDSEEAKKVEKIEDNKHSDFGDEKLRDEEHSHKGVKVGTIATVFGTPIFNSFRVCGIL